MTIFRLIEDERKTFFGGNHRYAFRHTRMPLDEMYRLYNCLGAQAKRNAEDKGEIVCHWLSRNEYYDHYPKKSLVTLDDARISVMRIDDGRIGRDTWWPEESRHPVWHTPIEIE